MRARAPRVVRDRNELLHAATLHRRVALLEQALVADRHGLHLLDRGGAALAYVKLEQRLLGLAVPHPRELVGEVDRVVDAAIQAEAAERIVEVRRVAGEEHAAAPPVRGDALMDAIDA